MCSLFLQVSVGTHFATTVALYASFWVCFSLPADVPELVGVLFLSFFPLFHGPED